MITAAEAKDVATRAVWTFLEAFLAIFMVTDLSTAETAAVSGLGAALSVVKTFVATKVAATK